MPNYDYECNACQHSFERFHGMLEDPKFACPECSSQDTYKKISGGAGIHFKGSGFYVTDYKNKPASPSNKEQGKTAESKTNQTDSKPSAGKEKKTSSTPVAK